MVAILLLALATLAGLAAAGSLADSGLRWWSVFGQLRRELKGDLAIQQPVYAMRPAIVSGGCTAFDRAGTSRVVRQSVRCAA